MPPARCFLVSVLVPLIALLKELRLLLVSLHLLVSWGQEETGVVVQSSWAPWFAVLPGISRCFPFSCPCLSATRALA